MAEGNMSDDNSIPPTGEPIEAASPSEQVSIAGIETKKPLVWVEEGEVKRLWDAVSSLKEELQAELSRRLSNSSSATEDKLRVCIKELEEKIEEKIKVILVRTKNEQVQLTDC